MTISKFLICVAFKDIVNVLTPGEPTISDRSNADQMHQQRRWMATIGGVVSGATEVLVHSALTAAGGVGISPGTRLLIKTRSQGEVHHLIQFIYISCNVDDILIRSFVLHFIRRLYRRRFGAI